MSRPPPPSLRPEREAWQVGAILVAGLDEAGRGPLAGPVVAAAVVINRAFLEGDFLDHFAGLTDSKQLTARRRATFNASLLGDPRIRHGLAQASVAEIDQLNILRATHLAMRRALDALGVCDHVLVDGLPVPGLGRASTALVGGDGRSYSIAAASVIAKVARDAMMDELDRAYPAYGFARHRGYGTAAHLKALREHGPCPAHRRSFAPVTQLLLPIAARGRD